MVNITAQQVCEARVALLYVLASSKMVNITAQQVCEARVALLYEI
jgi:hypothetical protein